MPTSRTDRNPKREAGMIAFVVVAFIAAGGIVYWTWSSQQGHAMNKVPTGVEGTALKLQMMKRMQAQPGSPGQ